MRRSVSLAVIPLSLFIVVASFVCRTSENAHSLTPQEILESSDLVRRFGTSYSSAVTITTYREDDIRSINKYEILTKDNADKVLANFIFPKHEMGKRILMVGRDTWIFLPDVGKPLKIPPSQRLIGNVAYGDILRINYAQDYNAILIGTEAIGDKECFVLSLKAKDDSATYGTVKYWVTTDDFHPIKAEYYTTLGKLIKTGVFENYRLINGLLRPTMLTLIDELRNTKSILEYSNVIRNEIPDKFFDKNYLRRLR